MAAKTWTVVDHAKNIHVDELVIRPGDVGGAAKGYSVTVRTLRAGLSQGVMSIHVDNGNFSYDIVPTRGMGIWKAWHGMEEIGWQSPVRGPVHPKFVAIAEPGGLGWLDGFDELFVRCGLENNGPPEFDDRGRLISPLHGRIANRPAYRVDISVDGDSGEISVTGEVEESRLHFAKMRLKTTIRTAIGESGFQVRDEVENFSQSPGEAQMLYHINFGRPLLDAGARFVGAPKTVVPRNARAVEGLKSWDSYAAEQPGYAEQVYFMDLASGADHSTQVLLKNAHGTRGVSLRFNNQQLPCFTLWKNTTATTDGYVTGLEPGTNYPNPRSFEGQHGRVVKLKPGASAVFDVALLYHASSAEIEVAEKTIRDLQGGRAPVIHNEPRPDWCS